MTVGRSALLLLVGAAGLLGVSVGYYVAMSDGLPVSWGVLVMIGLMVVALLTAFHGGRASQSGAPISGSSSPWDVLRLELDRSRRFDRTFVLMQIPGARWAGKAAHMSAAAGLARLSVMLRDIDRVWEVEGSIYVVLPEADRAAAIAMIDRLRSSSSLDGELDDVQIAVFPEDGLTAGALLAGLRPVRSRDERVPVRLVPTRAGPDRRGETRTG